MKMTVQEMAKLSGVSVRTLHYYDSIGLLSPEQVNPETNYRYYGEQEVEQMQQILFFRELDFPLKEIVKIMSQPSYDRSYALKRQREILLLKKERLDRILQLLNETEKGEHKMSFQEFDMSEIEKAKTEYEQEVKERWGNTDAYAQSQARTSKYTKEDWKKIQNEYDQIIQAFAKESASSSADSEKAQSLVEAWKAHITSNYYDCTDEILAGLGEMYVADERFQKNLDKFGEGTARFIRDAIRIYTGRNAD